MRSPANTLRLTCLACALLGATAPALADWGYTGFSGTQSATPFEPVTHVLGTSFTLQPGTYPYDATMRPDGEEVWIPGATGDRVTVIDRAGALVSHSIPVGDYPVSVAFSNDGSLALVSCRDSDRLDLISTDTYTVIGNLPISGTAAGPGNIALDPSTGNFYLVAWYSGLLFEIAPDASAVLRQASLGQSLWQLVVDPAGTELYITDRGNDCVRVIDRATLTETATVPVGDDPWGIDITEDGARLVTCCEDDHTVQIIDTATLAVTPYTLPECHPRDVDILDAQGKAYIPSGAIPSAMTRLFEFDLALATITYGFVFWDSDNSNVVAVQPQMAADYTATSGLPAGLRLAAQPNPVRQSTRLHFALPAGGPLRLSVFDIQGRELRVLFEGWQAAGAGSLNWDGRDSDGRELPAGLYLACLSSVSGARTAKLLLLP